MSTHTESTVQRIVRFPGKIQSLRALKQIDREHLSNLSRIELYAVLVEHWPKCSAEAREELMTHKDAFVRRNARELGSLVRTPGRWELHPQPLLAAQAAE